MARFDRAIKTAERLIEKNGQKIIWRLVKNGAAASDTPWKPSELADEDKDAIICFLPIGKESRQLFTFIRGQSDVPTGYVMGLMKGSIDFVPSVTDVVIRDGETLRIKSLDLLSPNGQKVLYTMEFEG